MYTPSSANETPTAMEETSLEQELALGLNSSVTLPPSVEQRMFVPDRPDRTLTKAQKNDFKKAASRRKKEEKKQAKEEKRELKRQKSMSRKKPTSPSSLTGTSSSHQGIVADIDSNVTWTDQQREWNQEVVPFPDSLHLETNTIENQTIEDVTPVHAINDVPNDVRSSSPKVVSPERFENPAREVVTAPITTSGEMLARPSPTPQPRRIPPMPLSQSQMASAFKKHMVVKDNCLSKAGLRSFFDELNVNVDSFVAKSIDDIVDTFDDKMEYAVCTAFLERLWEDSIKTNREFFTESVQNWGFEDLSDEQNIILAETPLSTTSVELPEDMEHGASLPEDMEHGASLPEDMEHRASLPVTSSDKDSAVTTAESNKPQRISSENLIIQAPKEDVSTQLSKHRRDIMPKLKNPHDSTGTATLTAGAAFIKNETDAQKIASSVHVVKTMTGKVDRSGADVSFYTKPSDRYNEQSGVLQFDGRNDKALLKAASQWVFYHKDIKNRLHATGALQSQPSGTFMLREDDAGDRLCLSFIHPYGITHHTLSQNNTNDFIKINVSAFMPESTTVVPLEGCTSLEDALDHLSVQHDYWPQAISNPYIAGDHKATGGESSSKTQPPVVNRKVPMRVHPEVARMVKERQQKEREKLDELSPVRRARSSLSPQPHKPRVLGGADFKEHKPIAKSVAKSTESKQTANNRVESKKEVSESKSDITDNKAPVPNDTQGFLSEFYHPGLSKKNAESLLLADEGASCDGKFLFRPDKKASGPGLSVLLSVVYKNKPTHHIVNSDEPGGVLSINKQKSSSTTLADLVMFLRKKRKELKWPIALTEGVKNENAEPTPQSNHEDVPESTTENTTDTKVNSNQDDSAMDSIVPTTERNSTSAGRTSNAPNKMDAQSLSIQQLSMAHSLTAEVRVDSGFSGGEKHHMQQNALDLRRGKYVGRMVSRVTQAKDFIQQTNIPNVPADSVAIKAQMTAQANASKLFNTMTGKVDKTGKADASHQLDIVSRKAELQQFGETVGTIDNLSSSISSSTLPIKQSVVLPSPQKLSHGFEDVIAAEAKKAAAGHNYKKGNQQAEPVMPLQPEPVPKKKSWKVSSYSPTKLKPDITHDDEVKGAAEKFSPAKGQPQVAVTKSTKQVATGDDLPSAPKEIRSDLSEESKVVDEVGAPETVSNTNPGFLFVGIKKSDAESKLRESGGADGTFLIRTKTKDVEYKSHLDFVLSVMYKGTPTHHSCKRQEEGAVFSLNGAATKCHSIEELMEYLREKRKELKWPVPLTEWIKT